MARRCCRIPEPCHTRTMPFMAWDRVAQQSPMALPLSILDLSPRQHQYDGREAFNNSLELAVAGDELPDLLEELFEFAGGGFVYAWGCSRHADLSRPVGSIRASDSSESNRDHFRDLCRHKRRGRLSGLIVRFGLAAARGRSSDLVPQRGRGIGLSLHSTGANDGTGNTVAADYRLTWDSPQRNRRTPRLDRGR